MLIIVLVRGTADNCISTWYCWYCISTWYCWLGGMLLMIRFHWPTIVYTYYFIRTIDNTTPLIQERESHKYTTPTILFHLNRKNKLFLHFHFALLHPPRCLTLPFFDPLLNRQICSWRKRRIQRSHFDPIILVQNGWREGKCIESWGVKGERTRENNQRSVLETVATERDATQ